MARHNSYIVREEVLNAGCAPSLASNYCYYNLDYPWIVFIKYLLAVNRLNFQLNNLNIGPVPRYQYRNI